jgi:hypothetical protein
VEQRVNNVNDNIGSDLFQGDDPSKTFAFAKTPPISPKQLIGITARCRLIRKV